MPVSIEKREGEHVEAMQWPSVNVMPCEARASILEVLILLLGL